MKYIKILLEGGADIHFKNKKGQTPLDKILNCIDLNKRQEIKDLFFKFQALLDKDNLNQSIAQPKLENSPQAKPIRL